MVPIFPVATTQFSNAKLASRSEKKALFFRGIGRLDKVNISSMWPIAWPEAQARSSAMNTDTLQQVFVSGPIKPHGIGHIVVCHSGKHKADAWQ